MKQAYEGLSFTGTLYYDILCAFGYRQENGQHYARTGWRDLGAFAKEYGYPVPNETLSHDGWEQYNKALEELEKRGLIVKEFYSRPCGRGAQAWYWRIKLVFTSKAIAIADKYVAAMRKHA